MNIKGKSWAMCLYSALLSVGFTCIFITGCAAKQPSAANEEIAMSENVFKMTINEQVFSIPCKMDDFLSSGWALASIPYCDHTYEENFYDNNAYYSPHEMGNTVGSGSLLGVLWYDNNCEIDVELTIVNPTKEELPIEECIVVGIKTRNPNDMFSSFGDKTIKEWSVDMFYGAFPDDWQRDTEKYFDDVKVKKYSVYRAVDELMQRCTLITNVDGSVESLGIEIQIPMP